MKNLTVESLLNCFKIDLDESDTETCQKYWDKHGSYMRMPVVIKDADGQCYNFEVYEGYRKIELQIKEKTFI